MSDEADTFTMKMAGRDIVFRRSHLGQLIMLQRTATRAIKNAESLQDEKARISGVSAAMVKVLDFIDGLVVDEQDRQFIEDKMLEGTITWQDLMAALSGGKSKDEADDEAPKPRKAPPKKSPKAAAVAGPQVATVRTPAKSPVATRGRTKR